MVGVGGRSHVKRCHTYRQRKVKYDGVSPTYRKYINQGLECPGYSRKLEFVFYETDAGPNKNFPAPVSSKTSLNLVQQAQSRRKPPTNYNVYKVVENFDLHESSSHGLAASRNKSGLMAVLRERYTPQLPKFSTEKGILNGANWIATACFVATASEFSEMLSDSLLAMSLALVNLEQQETRITTASLKQYSLAINGHR